jgi:hypothetical protein
MKGRPWWWRLMELAAFAFAAAFMLELTKDISSDARWIVVSLGLYGSYLFGTTNP